MRRFFLSAIILLAGCNAPSGNTTTPDSAPSATPARPSPAFTFRAIAKDTFAGAIPPGATPAEIDQAARKQCAGLEWCKVFGWVDSQAAATAFPLTDREAKEQSYGYTLNRASGMDESWFNCAAIKGAPKESCRSND